MGAALAARHRGLTAQVLRLREGTPIFVKTLTLGFGASDNSDNVTAKFQDYEASDTSDNVNYDPTRIGVELCPGDFNGDCVVNTQDVLAFLNAWNAGRREADCNGDGTINTQDVLCFLNLWNGGC